MADRLDGDDIVLRIAKLIAPEAYSEWLDATGNPPTYTPLAESRRAYQQSSALVLATAILQLVATEYGVRGLRRHLADIELRDWKRLGINGKGLREAVEAKHGLKP